MKEFNNLNINQDMLKDILPSIAETVFGADTWY
jgi:hypothetical protein